MNLATTTAGVESLTFELDDTAVMTDAVEITNVTGVCFLCIVTVSLISA